MAYKVYAKIHPSVPNFGDANCLIAEGVEEDAVTLLCREVAEFGFLVGGKVGTKIWIPPAVIVQMWANEESPLTIVE